MTGGGVQEAREGAAARPGDGHGIERRQSHWRGVRRWTAVLLGFWTLGNFGMPYFARALDFPFGGGSFSFWWAAQGAMLVNLALVVLYAWAAHRLDRRHGLDDED